MAPYGFTITKEMQFRGAPERFSNVYHYDVGALDPAGWKDYVDKLVASEKKIFGLGVSFKEARVFGPTNQGAALNVMQHIQDLTGTGALSSGLTYPELALIVSWPLSRSVLTGRKRFMRKFLHCQAGISGSTDPVPGAAQIALLNTYVTEVQTIAGLGGGSANLCTSKGDRPVAPHYILPRAQIRQLKR